MNKDQQSIDERLREIAAKLYNHEFFVQDKFPDSPILSHGDESVEAAIAQIKQAFADEGYTTPINSEGLINFGTEENPVMIHKDSLPFSPHNGGGYIDIPKDLRMTGQEWLDRFDEQMETIIHNVDFSLEDIREAAKRAAGLNKSSGVKDD